MSRIALGALVDMPAHAALEHYRYAERLGYESLWLTETRFTRDAITTAASAGMATKRLGIATGAINVYTRGPVLIATTFAGLDEITQGRAIAGIGAGSPSVLLPQGIPFDRPLLRLRETVEIVRRLWEGERITFEGETVTIRDVQLDFTPPRSRIPIYLAVTGPRALELAGEIADGVLLNSFVSPGYVRQAVEHIRRGADRAGRTIADIDIAGCVTVALAADRRQARTMIRPSLATYLACFPHIARQSGFDETEVETIRQAYNLGGAGAAASVVSDEMVDRLAVAGPFADCRERIAAYREAGLQLPVLDIVGPNITQTLEAMSAEAWLRERFT